MNQEGPLHFSARKPRIFTIGHSDLSIEGLIQLLDGSSVKMVVDVRSNPASSRFPHFERTRLAVSLDEAGINYRWFRALGGHCAPSAADAIHTALPESARAYATAMNRESFGLWVEELVGLSSSAVTAVLCAERDPRQCHRFLLADKIQQLGARVVHIIDGDNAFEHEPHSDLVIEAGKLIYRRKQLPLL